MYQFLYDEGIKEIIKKKVFPNFAIIRHKKREQIRYWECEEISQYLIFNKKNYFNNRIGRFLFLCYTI